MIPLTVPEVRRLLLAHAEPPEQRSFRLAWSTFRRRHQAMAKRCHAARRGRTHPPPAGSPAIQILPHPYQDLTDARWDRIAALLPPSSPMGRPPQEHRQLLAGILWVMRTGAAWREVPSHFGSWHTVDTRYQDWRHAGLWPQILEILRPEDAAHVP